MHWNSGASRIAEVINSSATYFATVIDVAKELVASVDRRVIIPFFQYVATYFEVAATTLPATYISLPETKIET